MAPCIMQGFANVAVCLERENSKRRFPGPTLQVRTVSVALDTVSIVSLNVSVRLCYLFARACAFAAVNRCARDL